MTAGAMRQDMMRTLGADCAVSAPARREIEPSDMHYAFASLARGWGWQAIAQQLRVNQTDLRRACGDLPAEAAGPQPVRGGACEGRTLADVLTPTRGRPVSAERAGHRIKVLAALADAPGALEDLVRDTGLKPADVRAAVYALRKRLLVEGGGRNGGVVLRLLPAGLAALEAWEAFDA